MATMTAANRIVNPIPARSADLIQTEAARLAHERALQAIDRAISACKRLAATGDSAAAREGRLVADMLHRISDHLFQTSTPVRQSGEWVR